MLLFIDGSANPTSKIGYGSYLLIPDDIEKVKVEFIRQEIKSKRFNHTSSTRLEAENLLWALRETEEIVKKEANNELITIISDSQNLIGLPNRRATLESRNFKSRKEGKDLKNADLYKNIYKILDRLNCRFVKVAGHSKSNSKTRIEWIFAQVDRSSRRALREHGNVNKT